MLAQVLLTVVAVYLLMGIVFAIAFVAKGAGKIDTDAAQGSWGFRVLIFPGCVMLWPLLLHRWMGVSKS